MKNTVTICLRFSFFMALFIAIALIRHPSGYPDQKIQISDAMLHRHHELINHYFTNNGIIYSSRHDADLSSGMVKCSGGFDSSVIESITSIKATRSHVWYRVTCAGFNKCDNTLEHTIWQVVIGRNDSSMEVKKLYKD